MAVIVSVMDTDLRLITNTLTHEERMMHRIRGLMSDLESGDGDMTYVENVLGALHEYLLQFDDEDLFMSTFKLKECIFYVANFNNE
jgi:hypothetical protein